MLAEEKLRSEIDMEEQIRKVCIEESKRERAEMIQRSKKSKK